MTLLQNAIICRLDLHRRVLLRGRGTNFTRKIMQFGHSCKQGYQMLLRIWKLPLLILPWQPSTRPYPGQNLFHGSVPPVDAWALKVISNVRVTNVSRSTSIFFCVSSKTVNKTFSLDFLCQNVSLQKKTGQRSIRIHLSHLLVEPIPSNRQENQRKKLL